MARAKAALTATMRCPECRGRHLFTSRGVRSKTLPRHKGSKRILHGWTTQECKAMGGGLYIEAYLPESKAEGRQSGTLHELSFG